MEKIEILYVLIGILILFDVHSLVRLVVRIKRAGKGNWKFRVSWRCAIVRGIRILFWLAFGLFYMGNGYDFRGECLIWGVCLIMVIGDIIDFINLSIEMKEIENKE